MDLAKVVAVIESPTKETIRRLFDDEGTVFWIDWRQEDETIPESCELVLNTGHLSGELIEDDSEEGYTVYLSYRDKRLQVPLSYSSDDRHITLCALNQVLAPEYEVRFCIDSNDSDTLGFLPLPCEQWAELEQRYGEAVAKRFYRFSERPNLFTDQVSF